MSFSKVWSIQQSIVAGEEIMAVVLGLRLGENTSSVVAKATLPAANAGKVQSGMRAIIRLGGLSAQEYGALEAHVAHMPFYRKKKHTCLICHYPIRSLPPMGNKSLSGRKWLGRCLSSPKKGVLLKGYLIG